jgi:undecaprenyl-diphosphatase
MELIPVITELLKTFYRPEGLNHQLFMAINHAHHPLVDPIMEACITLGSSRVIYWYAALLFLVALVRRDIMPFRYIWLYILAVAISIGAEELLKVIFQIPRPALAIGRDRVLILGEIKLYNSFPSGHATFAFLTAYMLSYRRSLAWKLPLFVFAILVGWSRIYVGAHYPMDVVGGAILGMSIGFMVWKVYEFFARRLVKEEPGVKEKE